jgi:hypothetical protein
MLKLEPKLVLAESGPPTAKFNTLLGDIVESDDIEQQFINYCRRLGYKSSKNSRLYWPLTFGWPTTPDVAHNAMVEAAAIACVRKNLGQPSKDRQKDNCGWDLEFLANGRTLCVEVKGLAGAEIGVELTPNEYAAMTRAMEGTFTEGDYRLAIVCEALSDVPRFFLFRHEKECVGVASAVSARLQQTSVLRRVYRDLIHPANRGII